MALFGAFSKAGRVLVGKDPALPNGSQSGALRFRFLRKLGALAFRFVGSGWGLYPPAAQRNQGSKRSPAGGHLHYLRVVHATLPLEATAAARRDRHRWRGPACPPDPARIPGSGLKTGWAVAASYSFSSEQLVAGGGDRKSHRGSWKVRCNMTVLAGACAQRVAIASTDVERRGVPPMEGLGAARQI